MNKRIIFHLVLLLLLKACSSAPKKRGPMVAKQQAKEENMLSHEFKKTVDLVKVLISDNQYDQALTILYKVEQNSLNKLELTFLLYLTALNHFHKGQNDQAVKLLTKANKNNTQEPFLKNQIKFYLGMSLYQLGKNNNSLVLSNFAQAELKHLTVKNIQKIIKLKDEILTTQDRIIKKDFADIVFYLRSFSTWEELKVDPVFQNYSVIIKNLPMENIVSMMDPTTKKNPFENYLIYTLALNSIYSLESSNNFDKYFQLLKSKEPSDPEQAMWVKELANQYENLVRLKMGKIGVILPLTGAKEKFGKRIVNGLNAAINAIKEKNPQVNVQIIYRDSAGLDEQGREKVKELVEKESVSAIIGGLFPQEAKSEYLMAKELGVLFISLSTLYLHSNEKNMLLIEIPGSVESITYHFQQLKTVENLGDKGGIIYHGDEKGETYFSSFWNHTQRSKIKINALDSIDPEQNNYTQVVERVLGLHYPKERMEEKRIIEEINSLYPRKSSKKMQALSPVVDFQWIFLPILPDAASAIIPIFKYYEAQNIKFIGGPSWRSPLLQGTSKNRPLYFFDAEIKVLREKTTQYFMPLFNENPGLLEMNAFEALFASYGLMQATAEKKKSIQAAGGEWFLDENSQWIKRMNLFSYKNAQIKAVEF